MNDRKRAIAVLREARQILSDRLTERVLETAEEILADARGESYMNDIETVYEQVGIKLAHVNQMLSNLPAGAEPPQSQPAARSHSGPAATTPNSDEGNREPLVPKLTTAALPPPARPVTRALPPSKPAPQIIPLPHRPFDQPARPRTFQAFASQVQAGDLLAAGRSLAGLFELPEARAITCAAVFADRLQSDHDFIRRAAELRSEIEEGSFNRAVVLLHDCFGLTATEAITVLQTLRRRLRLSY